VTNLELGAVLKQDTFGGYRLTTELNVIDERLVEESIIHSAKGPEVIILDSIRQTLSPIHQEDSIVSYQ
jgi:hypothetical protein